MTHRPRLHSLCEFLDGCAAFVSQDHLALEGAFLKDVAFLAQVGCDGSQLHGLDALGSDELVGCIAGGGDGAQELNVHWGQAFISHGFFCAGQLRQCCKTLFGDLEGVHAGAGQALTLQVSAAVQPLDGSIGDFGIQTEIVGLVTHVDMTDTEELEDLLILIFQCDIFTVAVVRDKLPAGFAVIFRRCGQGCDHCSDKSDNETEGGQINVCADVEDAGQVEQGEDDHGSHTADRTDESTSGVEFVPYSAEAEQDRRRYQPAVGECEQVCRAARELAENKGHNTDQDHGDLGEFQSQGSCGIRLNDTLIDIAGHDGRCAEG